MIVVDTTVLVYAVGEEHPLRAPCRWVLAQIGEGAVAAATTVEVIQELVHVRARRRGREDAVAIGRAFATLLAPLLRPSAEDLDAGLDLLVEHESLGAFDAVLAATARRSDAALVSADRAFADVGGLVHLDPASGDFRDRVEAGANRTS